MEQQCLPFAHTVIPKDVRISSSTISLCQHTQWGRTNNWMLTSKELIRYVNYCYCLHAQCMICSLYDTAPNLNILIARMLFNAQYAHYTYAVNMLIARMLFNAQYADCTYAVQCSICSLHVCCLMLNMLIACMLFNPQYAHFTYAVQCSICLLHVRCSMLNMLIACMLLDV